MRPSGTRAADASISADSTAASNISSGRSYSPKNSAVMPYPIQSGGKKKSMRSVAVVGGFARLRYSVPQPLCECKIDG